MFFKKKPKYRQIKNVNQIKTHLREFIMDSQIPDGDEISVELGCPPISDELLEKEEQESDNRVERISFLIPLLYGYSSLFAEAFVSTMPEPFDEEKNPIQASLYKSIHRQTRMVLEESMAHLLIGAVSQMVDLELLELPKGKRR